jgi:hypothetical protein
MDCFKGHLQERSGKYGFYPMKYEAFRNIFSPRTPNEGSPNICRSCRIYHFANLGFDIPVGILFVGMGN